jgi:hypothetical protein
MNMSRNTRARSAARSRSSLLLIAVFLATALFTAGRAAAAASSQLFPRLTTNKGCLETGDDATFTVGERVIVFLAIDSPTLDHANATLFSIKSSGFVTAFVLGTLVTNATYALSARVGLPEGVHELQLKASAAGEVRRRSCSFNVVMSGTPKPTKTPTVTRTATPTRTPTPVMSPPSGALEPHITTNRGCKETGDDPVFLVGDPITVSFDIGSDSLQFARATLFDFLPNGFVNVFEFGNVTTNDTHHFSARVAPPTGTETLKLRARATGFDSASSTCSFTVRASVPYPTRTKTPTRTPTVTPTSTPTPTATP